MGYVSDPAIILYCTHRRIDHHRYDRNSDSYILNGSYYHFHHVYCRLLLKLQSLGPANKKQYNQLQLVSIRSSVNLVVKEKGLINQMDRTSTSNSHL